MNQVRSIRTFFMREAKKVSPINDFYRLNIKRIYLVKKGSNNINFAFCVENSALYA